MVVPPDALSTRLGVGDLVEGLRSQHLELAVDQADARKIEIVVGGLHDPRLQIADRAWRKPRKPGKTWPVPDFPSQAARVLHADRGARLTADASSRLAAERGGKRGEERHDALRAQGRAAVGGAQHP